MIQEMQRREWMHHGTAAQCAVAGPVDLDTSVLSALFDELAEELEADWEQESLPKPSPEPGAVLRLASPAGGDGVCICQNLITAAGAFSRLTDAELSGLPLELQRHTHSALVGVWQILELLGPEGGETEALL